MQTNNNSERLAAFLMLTLLFFAFVLSGTIAFIHSEGHDHTKHCSSEDESDACHIAVFHLDLESGCTHKVHVFDVDESCFLCHLILPDNTQEFLNSDRSISNYFFAEIGHSVYQINFEKCPAFYNLRAPPVCT